jgi:hypothetical protein
MLKIEVSSEVQSREVSPEGKKPFVVYYQDAWAWIPGNKYPQRIELRVSDPHSGFKQAAYQLGAESFRVGRFGSLELSRELQLRPLDAVKVA